MIMEFFVIMAITFTNIKLIIAQHYILHSETIDLFKKTYKSVIDK